MVKYLNVRPEPIKLLSRKQAVCSLTSVLAMVYRYISSSKGNKSKNKQVELHQTTKVLHSEGRYQQNKKATYWIEEDICKQFAWPGVNIQNIKKNLCNSVPKHHQQQNNPLKKWADVLVRHFSKEHKQMASKHMKIYSVSVIIREMQIKTPMKYHWGYDKCHTNVRMAIIKKTKNKKC